MANKLWEKNFEVNAEIERFTVGRDREMDLYLAKYDVLGSMAHITMLESIGLIGKDELPLPSIRFVSVASSLSKRASRMFTRKWN